MRPISAAAQAILDTGNQAVSARVLLKMSASDTRNLCDLNGYDFLESIDIRESVDDPHIAADITLKREVYGFSLSPFITTSAINRNNDPGGAFNPPIALRREVSIEVSIHPIDGEPTSWMQVFHGRIDRFDNAASPDTITLECRDMGAGIQDAFIEAERVYGLTGGYSTHTKGCRIWSPSVAYAVNELMIPASSLNGRFYRCTVAGTSAAAEPSWTTTVGIAQTDGGVTWVCEGNTDTVNGVAVQLVLQAMLNDNMSAPPALHVPADPVWSVLSYKQSREALLSAMRTVTQQLGHDVRYRWRESAQAFELTLHNPDRAKTIHDRAFSPSQYDSIDGLSLDIAGIRNVVRVIYDDKSTKETDGKTYKRRTYEASDAGSIAAYERRFMELSEASSSLIDSAAEAQRYAEACLSDVSSPEAEQSVSMPFFPWAELGDLYRFEANGVHSDSVLDLAVVGIQHSLQAGGGTMSARSAFICRGKPSGAFKRWHELAVLPGLSISHQLQPLDGGVTIRAQSIVGGVRLSLNEILKRPKNWDGAQIHIGTVSTFLPSTSSLRGVARSDSFEVSDLTPGQTYWARAVSKLMNDSQPVFGAPSPAVEFVAGYAAPAHLNPEIDYGGKPLNGNFEAYSRGLNNEPDRWRSDEWNDGFFRSTSGPFNGTACVDIFVYDLAQVLNLETEPFQVTPGVNGEVSFWYRTPAFMTGEDQILLTVSFYSDKGVTLLSGYQQLIGPGSATWARYAYSELIPAGARYAKIGFSKGANSADATHQIDAVRFSEESVVLLTMDPPESFVNGFGNWATVSGNTHVANLEMRREGRRVFVHGMLSCPTTAPTVYTQTFTIPDGMRPKKQEPFRVVGSNNAIYEVLAEADGRFLTSPNTPSDGYLCLSGINWPID